MSRKVGFDFWLVGSALSSVLARPLGFSLLSKDVQNANTAEV
jgi:hypothetical protein